MNVIRNKTRDNETNILFGFCGSNSLYSYQYEFLAPVILEILRELSVNFLEFEDSGGCLLEIL